MSLDLSKLRRFRARIPAYWITAKPYCTAPLGSLISYRRNQCAIAHDLKNQGVNMMTYRSIPAVVIVLLSCTTGMPAQNNPAPVKGMASTVGLYVYPRNNQTGVQQLTDEGQCYSSAKTQTGFDPNGSSPAATTSTPSQPKQGDHTVGKDAARGAAISGAAGGDPAMGARRGAMDGGNAADFHAAPAGHPARG